MLGEAHRKESQGFIELRSVLVVEFTVVFNPNHAYSVKVVIKLIGFICLFKITEHIRIRLNERNQLFLLL